MKFFKKIRKLNNKGLTLVELITVMAILAIAGTVIGTIVMTSSNSYDKGMTEIELQQEAQMVVNQISDLVIDASTDPATSNSVTYEPYIGLLTIPEAGPSGIETLHYVRFIPDANGNGKLMYNTSQHGAVSSPELMADGIASFSADTTSFADTGNLYLNIGLKKSRKAEDRVFNATFHITSRNGVVETIPMAYVRIEENILLEPNQSYTFTTSVEGISNQNVELELVGGNTSASTRVVGKTVYIADNEKGSVIHLIAKTEEKDANGVPMAMTAVNVKIRRVDKITCTGTLISGVDLKNGAVYKIEARMEGTYLEKDLSVPNDTDYVAPYEVGWEFSANNTQVPRVVSYWAHDPMDPTKAVCTIQLKEDMPRLSSVTVKVTAKHPAGVNKTGIAYDNVFDEYVIENFSYYTVTGGLSRGSDVAIGEFDGLDALKQLLIEKYGNGNYQPVKWHRYRAVNADGTRGPWTAWLGGDPNDPTDKGTSINIRPCSGLQMDYDKAYEVQVKLTMINADVRNPDGTYLQVWPEASTPQRAYLIDAVMNKVSLKFKSTTCGFAAQSGYRYTTSLSTGFYDGLFQLDEVASLKRDLAENNICYILEKKVGGSWSSAGLEQPQTNSPSCKVRFNSAGDYRIKIYVKDAQRCPGYGMEHDKFDYHPSNEATGEGIFYFNVN